MPEEQAYRSHARGASLARGLSRRCRPNMEGHHPHPTGRDHIPIPRPTGRIGSDVKQKSQASFSSPVVVREVIRKVRGKRAAFPLVVMVTWGIVLMRQVERMFVIMVCRIALALTVVVDMLFVFEVGFDTGHHALCHCKHNRHNQFVTRRSEDIRGRYLRLRRQCCKRDLRLLHASESVMHWSSAWDHRADVLEWLFFCSTFFVSGQSYFKTTLNLGRKR
jgi:hypothetical protein